MSGTDLPVAELPNAPVDGTDADARYEQLARATEGVGRQSIPLDRWLQIAGAVLMPLGIVLILLGWYGTAHTSRPWEQTPYVVSGGLLGLALVFAGGFSYFAHWLMKLADDSRRQADAALMTAERTLAALERVEQLLGENAGSPARANPETPFVATATGSMVHRSDCPMVQGKQNLRSVRADEPGLRPCMVCDPAVVTNGATARRAAGRSGAR